MFKNITHSMQWPCSGMSGMCDERSGMDTSLSEEKYGVDLMRTDSENIKVEYRVRQYNSADRDYYELKGWRQIGDGFYEFSVSVDKHVILQGGPTILEFSYSVIDAAYFSLSSQVDVVGNWRRLYTLILESRLVRACEEGEDYRFGFGNHEKVNEIAGIGNHNTALFWEYDTRTARRWNIDLVMKPWESPYSVLGGNPILNIDPLGDDWFKNSDGQTTWHKATGKTGDKVSLKGMEGEWENIGTEFLEFNGKSVKYSWQSTNEDGDLVVNSQTFDAVSGKGQDPTGYWNLTRVFDYSDGRQGQKNAGPTPEGLYSINKRAFIPNKNESGFQQFSDLSLGKKAAAPFGFSNWPGGRASWGDYRWKLQFEKADRAIGAGRDNFYLHGGSLWGSRGCIDCGAGINDFTKSFMGRQLGNDKVFLKVEYAEGLKFKIQNTPTNQGLRLTR